MSTYLRRNMSKVQPQPRTSLTAGQLLAQPVAQGTGPRLFVGLDVHTDSIAVSLAPSDSTEVRRYGIIGGAHDDVLRLAKKLQAAHPDCQLRFCYEAGPHGYPLCRCLLAHGYHSIIVAPSKIPRKPGDRVKTNRRDADQLARLYRAGELTAIYVPDPQDESVRDFIRARFQVHKQQHRARQQLKMFLLRHNLRYAGTTAWTPQHLRYLASVKLPFPEQQFLYQEMLNVISDAADRLARYDAYLPRVVAGWRWEPVVKALLSLRGIARLNAVTIVAKPLISSALQIKASSWVISAWFPVKTPPAMSANKAASPKWAIPSPAAPSSRPLGTTPSRPHQPRIAPPPRRFAQNGHRPCLESVNRLHHRYQHLTTVKHKKSQVAAAALGRELSGFVWSIAQIIRPRAVKT